MTDPIVSKEIAAAILTTLEHKNVGTESVADIKNDFIKWMKFIDHARNLPKQD